MRYTVHSTHLRTKYSEGNQDPGIIAGTIVVFLGTKMTPLLEQQNMRKRWPKEKVSRVTFFWTREHCSYFCKALIFIYLLPNDVIVRGIKKLFFQLSMKPVTSYLRKHTWEKHTWVIMIVILTCLFAVCWFCVCISTCIHMGYVCLFRSVTQCYREHLDHEWN